MTLTRSLAALLVFAAAGSVLAVAPAFAQEASSSPSPTAATPTSSSTCFKPIAQVEDSFAVSPQRIAAGDPVTVQALAGGTYDLCNEGPQARRETHTFRVGARQQGQAEFTEVDRRTVETVNGSGYEYRATPTVTTEFRVFIDDRPATAATAPPSRSTGSRVVARARCPSRSRPRRPSGPP